MLKNLALIAILGYKYFLSPIVCFLGLGQCKFKITCSEFASLAIKQHGVVRGTKFAWRRIASCI